MAFMDSSQFFYTVLFTLIIGLALVSGTLNRQHGRDEHCIILVLRAVGRRSDVRRGEDEHLWARHYYAIFLIHSCSRIWLPNATWILMFCSQAYLALLAWTPPPPYELPSEKQYRTPKAPKTLRPLPSIDDAASLDLSIIVPAYNETKRLPSMLSSTLEHLASFPKRTFEILVVDDHSSDGTAAFVLKHAAERYPKADIRVVQLERNLGKGGAVRHGMLHARGRRLLMVDADDASRFADVELLLGALDALAPMETEDALGVAIGSRAHLVNTEAVVKVRFFQTSFLISVWHWLTTRRVAVFPAQLPYVRLAHRPAHRGRRAHP